MSFYLEVIKALCSRQARPQRGSPWKAAGNREGTKGGAIFRAEYHTSPRHGKEGDKNLKRQHSQANQKYCQ
jgi:hypothetical protein